MERNTYFFTKCLSIDCKQDELPIIWILLVANPIIFVKDSILRCRMITTCNMPNSNIK